MTAAVSWRFAASLIAVGAGLLALGRHLKTLPEGG